jgi:hypothetical protein
VLIDDKPIGAALATSLRSRAEEYDHRARVLLEDRGEGA